MSVIIDLHGTEPRAILNAADFRSTKVVDIGCGDGRVTSHFAAEAGFVIGIDPKAEALSRATSDRTPALASRLYYVRASATDLPLRAGVFDIAIFSKSL